MNIDPGVAKSIQHLEDIIRQKKRLEQDRSQVERRELVFNEISPEYCSVERCLKTYTYFTAVGSAPPSLYIYWCLLPLGHTLYPEQFTLTFLC